jgi:chaperonin GroES
MKNDRLSKLRDEAKGNIPPVPYLPVGEVVLVYRLPSDEKTAGGLYVPEEHRSPVSAGILIAAGLAARDVMADALIETGDIVYFARFAGDEKEFKREAAGKAEKLLQLKMREILGSADALERSRNYEVALRTNEDGTTEHIYKRRAA